MNSYQYNASVGHIKGFFLSCCAALTARVGVRCSVRVCVSVRMRGLFLTTVGSSYIILSFLLASEL